MKTPHLLNAEVTRVAGTPFGDPAYFRIAETHFPDRARFEEAMVSPENRAAGRGMMTLAKHIITLLVAE